VKLAFRHSRLAQCFEGSLKACHKGWMIAFGPRGGEKFAIPRPQCDHLPPEGGLLGTFWLGESSILVVDFVVTSKWWCGKDGALTTEAPRCPKTR
jgi:hypothetical protein